MKRLMRIFSVVFGRLFHKRSIIIISEKKTNHVALSAPLQIASFALVIGCVVWASYSTGRFMATTSALEERDLTIKSVANSRVDTNFSYMVGAGASAPSMIPPRFTQLTDPSYTLSAVTHDKLFARIAMLENRVQELKSTNAEIIQTVREKTQDRILNMEEIIRQTGLSPAALKEDATRLYRQRARSESNAENSDTPQGGPFIPAEVGDSRTSPISRDMENKLEQLAMLGLIVDSLPLSQPMRNAEMLSSNFGRRVDPFTGRLAFHAGVDISGPAGAKILATADGTVISAGWEGAYGNAVDIDHGLGIVTRYGHMSAISVEPGQKIKKGEVVGVQGSTGRSTGPHLHYEVRYNDRPLNPANFLRMERYVSQAE